MHAHMGWMSDPYVNLGFHNIFFIKKYLFIYLFIINDTSRTLIDNTPFVYHLFRSPNMTGKLRFGFKVSRTHISTIFSKTKYISWKIRHL
jgi:hypothetical protein